MDAGALEVDEVGPGAPVRDVEDLLRLGAERTQEREGEHDAHHAPTRPEQDAQEPPPRKTIFPRSSMAEAMATSSASLEASDAGPPRTGPGGAGTCPTPRGRSRRRRGPPRGRRLRAGSGRPPSRGPRRRRTRPVRRGGRGPPPSRPAWGPWPWAGGAGRRTPPLGTRWRGPRCAGDGVGDGACRTDGRLCASASVTGCSPHDHDRSPSQKATSMRPPTPTTDPMNPSVTGPMPPSPRPPAVVGVLDRPGHVGHDVGHLLVRQVAGPEVRHVAGAGADRLGRLGGGRRCEARGHSRRLASASPAPVMVWQPAQLRTNNELPWRGWRWQCSPRGCPAGSPGSRWPSELTKATIWRVWLLSKRGGLLRRRHGRGWRAACAPSTPRSPPWPARRPEGPARDGALPAASGP